jgi:hypothetical protein
LSRTLRIISSDPVIRDHVFATNTLGIDLQDRRDYAVIIVKLGTLDDALLAGQAGCGEGGGGDDGVEPAATAQRKLPA